MPFRGNLNEYPTANRKRTTKMKNYEQREEGIEKKTNVNTCNISKSLVVGKEFSRIT